MLLASASASAETIAVIGTGNVGMVVEDVVDGFGNFAGKIVIDATNPLVMDQPMVFRYGVATSNGEIVRAAAPLPGRSEEMVPDR